MHWMMYFVASCVFYERFSCLNKSLLIYNILRNHTWLKTREAFIVKATRPFLWCSSEANSQLVKGEFSNNMTEPLGNDFTRKKHILPPLQEILQYHVKMTEDLYMNIYRCIH